MRTEMYSAPALEDAAEAIRACADILRRGGVVAFPTETVYGLGADARKSDAIRAVFAAKGRPADNPLIVHVADAEAAWALASRADERAKLLAQTYWPGPLTLVLRKGDHVLPEVSAGLDTVGVRVPDHPVALALLREFNGPVAAPSANVSGKPSPTTARHVADDLSGKIDAILDGGPTGVGLESTVVDLSGAVPTVLRLGGLPVEALRHTLGAVHIAAEAVDGSSPTEDVAVRSPGMKYKHYAPKAPLCIVRGNRNELVRAFEDLWKQADFAHRDHHDRKTIQPRPAFLLSLETAKVLGAERHPGCFVLGSLQDPHEIARHLYDGLRTLDRREPSVIYAESFADLDEVGATVMDRLRRAAQGHELWASGIIERSSR